MDERPENDAQAKDVGRFSDAYLMALLGGDEVAAEVAIREAMEAGFGMAQIDHGIIAPAMWFIGELWERGEISVAEEHLASEITVRVLALQREAGRVTRDRSARRVLLATPAGELHVIALRMVSNLLREAGYEVVMLGPDLPPDALGRAAARWKPDVVCLSTTMPGGDDRVLIAMYEVQHRRPEATFLIGGRGLVVARAPRPGHRDLRAGLRGGRGGRRARQARGAELRRVAGGWRNHGVGAVIPPPPTLRGVTDYNQTTTSEAVHASGLVKAFGDFRAVDGIDLDVRQGEIFGVLGPNGAGKTTMLRMLATLLPIDGGRRPHLRRRRRPRAAPHPPAHRRHRPVRVGRRGPDRDARTCGSSGACRACAPRPRARPRTTLLEQFGLEEAADRPLSQFSGGMRRRLDLAASLITRPPLIFLDEPTTGLDPRTRGQMWDTIRGLVADGCTVLLTTQYLDEADQLADRIAVIDRGRKVAEGTPDELKASVGDSTLQLQLADGADQALARDVVRRVARRRAGADARVRPHQRRRSIVADRAGGRADRPAPGRRSAIDSVSVAKPTLDEVFLALTGHEPRRPRSPTPTTDDEPVLEVAR